MHFKKIAHDHIGLMIRADVKERNSDKNRVHK
jgi:hypothetical protein